MRHPYTSLTLEYARIARKRRLPWVTNLLLIESTGAMQASTRELCDLIVHTVRSYDTDEARSDKAIRALAHIGASEPDALTVLLYALAPQLDFRLWRSATTAYRTGALTELTIVIRSSTDSNEINNLSNLARRLTRRAHSRSHRHSRPPEREVPWDTAWIAPHDGTSRTRPPADAVADIAEISALRLDLQTFLGALKTKLSDTAWAAYRDHRLVRAIAPDGHACSDTTRATASRADRQAQRHVTKHLMVHA